MENSKAQIVATIGPNIGSEEMIKNLVEHQVDVFRLNFSWGTYEEHLSYIENIRSVAKELGKQIPIIQDLSGPRAKTESGHKFDSSIDKILTQKDLEDLEWGLEHEVDYIAMSFVGTKNDVIFLKDEIRRIGYDKKVIAKIERQLALDNIDEIIDMADAIMIARGDLGLEVPLEKIPFIELDILKKCKAKNKPVITATQMLLSMTEQDLPTRAEVTDVMFAIVNGSDAVMLSEETAIGKYPIEAVSIMEDIIVEAEKNMGKVAINPLVA